MMTAPSHSSKNQTQTALQWSIGVAFFLALLKLLAGFFTNSMAVMASALDSFLDVATSMVNLFASWKAAKPPDEDHAYGHEKIESLAALFQSTFIGISGIVIVTESFKRLLFGSLLREISMGIYVMLFCMGVTWVLAWRLEVAARKTHSMILSTERLHYSMDLLTNFGAMAALFLVRLTGFVFWDLIVSLLVSGMIFKMAFQILRKAVDELLDRSLPPISKEEIEKTILNHHPSITGFHNFRSRRVGSQTFMDFHIEIRGEDDFRRAHLMTESLIARLQQDYPGADITVHYDPEGES